MLSGMNGSSTLMQDEVYPAVRTAGYTSSCINVLLPFIPESMMPLRYVAFVAVYFVWVIGYTFQTSCTRAGQTVLTNDPNQRPMFTIFNTVGSLLGGPAARRPSSAPS